MNVYAITKDFMKEVCKIDSTESFANGAKLHKMNDSCILESPTGKLTLYVGMFQKVFEHQRALSTKKPVMAVSK